MKKLISVLLSAAIVFGCLPLISFAAYSDAEKVYTKNTDKVYFNEEYANGRISELTGMKIDTVKLYSEQVKDPEITITQMSFEDGDARLNFGSGVLYAGKGVDCNE